MSEFTDHVDHVIAQSKSYISEGDMDREVRLYDYLQFVNENIDTIKAKKHFDALKTAMADLTREQFIFPSNIPILPAEIRNKIINHHLDKYKNAIHDRLYDITTFFGLPHSFDDNPAIITRFKSNSRIMRREWYKYGKLHRNKGPALIKYDEENGSRIGISYFINGKLHRDHGPASIDYNNGSISSISYYKNGFLHHIRGPAELIYYSTGGLAYEEYYQNGKLHNIDGPAVIRYFQSEIPDSNGPVKHQYYYENGILHRLNGPAKIYYDENGRLKSEQYYENGKFVDEHLYKKI